MKRTVRSLCSTALALTLGFTLLSAPAGVQAAGNADYNLTGFSQGNTGGGVISESNTAVYKKVYNATDLALALKKNSGVKVVEIMNDLNLGWNEIPSAAQTSPFAKHNDALTHPVLKQTGVSKITVDGFNGLTIFSANGSKIKHAAISVKRSSNVIIRNLEFDELWEWDESTKGDYDKNDWDYITLEESSGVWIDHCTFNKAYDGLVDSKKGTSGVTISWSAFKGDDGSPNSWVTRQINEMEANKASYPMYNYLRSSAVGLSKEDIIAISGSQKKVILSVRPVWNRQTPISPSRYTIMSIKTFRTGCRDCGAVMHMPTTSSWMPQMPVQLKHVLQVVWQQPLLPKVTNSGLPATGLFPLKVVLCWLKNR